jgi:hypothetical protein
MNRFPDAAPFGTHCPKYIGFPDREKRSLIEAKGRNETGGTSSHAWTPQPFSAPCRSAE